MYFKQSELDTKSKRISVTATTVVGVWPSIKRFLIDGCPEVHGQIKFMRQTRYIPTHDKIIKILWIDKYAMTKIKGGSGGGGKRENIIIMYPVH